jgi:phosphoglycolate phosphatase-like HAD superfamily hydrolase
MENAQELLKNLKKENEFFIGIDSDGCVFDTMELKQKECFRPAFINHFELQAVSKFGRQAWDFVNLYSRTRGCNRYPALVDALDYLRKRKEVIRRGIDIVKLPALEKWISEETKLGLASLKKRAEETDDPELKRVLAWSEDVNKAVADIVRGAVPFLNVRECLSAIKGKADAIVVSQTPVANLKNEWAEHKIDDNVRLIAGQEMGTKTEHIALSAVGKYESDKILMIGDAPGDMEAALANNALFFPICPGEEEESWRKLYEEGLGRFFSQSFRGAYQEELIEEFSKVLPENPPWK